MTPHRANTLGWQAYWLGEDAPAGMTDAECRAWMDGLRDAIEEHTEQRRVGAEYERRKGR